MKFPSALPLQVLCVLALLVAAGSGAVRALLPPSTDGDPDPEFGDLGKVFAGTSVNAAHTPRAAGTSPDGQWLWWASSVDDSGTNKFGFVVSDLSGGLLLECSFLPAGATSATLGAAAMDAQGRVVLAGAASIGGHSQIAAMRIDDFDPGSCAGEVDLSFDETSGNGDGWAIYDLSVSASAAAVAFDRAGGIALAGNLRTSLVNRDILVMRLTANGARDSSFDADGVRVIDWNGKNDFGTAVVVTENAAGTKVVWVAGEARFNLAPPADDSDFFLARLSTAGAVLSATTIAFDLGGTFDDGASALAWDAPRHRMYAAGTAANGDDFTLGAVVAYAESGAIDAAFSGDGKQVFLFDGGPFPFDHQTSRSAAVQSDGRLVVAGDRFQTDSGYDPGVVRFTTTGDLDSNFSSDGRVLVPFELGGTFDDHATAVLLPDGRAFVAGCAQVSATAWVPTLVRLRSSLVFSDGFESGTTFSWSS